MYNFHNKYDSKNKNNPSIVEKKNSDNKKAVKDEVKIKDDNNVKANNPWDILGITEDQYYNKPLYSWERVDFSTYEECANYGESYKPYLNGEELYHCSTVSSASGKNLGWMFHTEKLN